MKKIVYSILLFVLVFSLVGCRSYNDTNITTNSTLMHESEKESSTIVEEVDKEKQLSSDYGTIVATGYDGNDFYELIVDKHDGFPDATFEFGVIKNNEWLVPMSTACPFIDENGRWKGLSDGEANTVYKKQFGYIDEGCFMYSVDANNWILYKPQTGVSFNVKGVSRYINVATKKYALDEIVNDNKAILIDKESNCLALFNMEDGTKEILKGDIAEYNLPNNIYGLHEGLFFAMEPGLYAHRKPDYVGFFDTSGNLIIDLNTYDAISYYKYGAYFSNGQYSFAAYNSSGDLYKITIDTTGKIISQEKIEN